MQIDPYLMFDGTCEEALGFYRDALGAEIQTIMRFKDHPPALESGMVPADAGDKVMHASFTVGGRTVLASDGRCMGKPKFEGFSLSLAVPDVAEAERLFGLLGAGGEVRMPMAETFFAPRFGMVADRFGVTWMVSVAP